MINSTMNSNETMPLLDSGGENSEDDIKNYMAFKISKYQKFLFVFNNSFKLEFPIPTQF